MKKLLKYLLALASTNVMADAVIFSGSDVKTLKSNIDINGNSKILSGTTDPSSVATSAPIGSLYLNTSNSNLYKKTDSGLSTNWLRMATDTVALTTITNANHTALTTDETILFSTGNSNRTLTLFAASGNTGKILRVKKIDSGTGIVTIDANASETIEGALTFILNHQYDEVSIVCDGSNWHILETKISPTVQSFLSGSGTYTTPNGVKYIRVRMVGGGAGGTGGGSSGSSGTAGGNSTFGSSLLVANGGGAGGSGTGGGGGTASLGTGPVGLAITGGSGEPNNTSPSPAGTGGDSPLFGGGGTGSTAGGAGAPAVTNTGGGGQGGSASGGNVAGAGGGSGGFVDAIIYTPSTTYSYAVGAGGAGGAGSGGSGPVAGGAGADGQIIVEEFY